MTDDEILTILKADLDIIYVDTGKEEFLMNCIRHAKSLIEREGIKLKETIEDGNLVVMYAAYLYRKRQSNDPMPRMLRYAMNNRLLSQKARDEDGA